MFGRKKKQVMRVRIQHVDLDNAAIEGVLVGRLDDSYRVLAAKTIIEGVEKPIPHRELLVPTNKVVFIEVLSREVWTSEYGTT